MTARPPAPPARLSRRRFLATSALGAAGATAAAAGALGPAAAHGEGDGFVYEVSRTEEDWRARLTPEEYAILREGGTETPKTSPLWNETRDGGYACRGCDLPLYESAWKAPVDKGWVFFAHSVPNAVLTGIDDPQVEYGMDPALRELALIEAHCRRCGSHLGHILTVEGKTLHCINGTSLRFAPSEA